MKAKFLIGMVCSVLCLFSSGQSGSSKMIVTLGDFENKTTADKSLFETLIDRITNEIINTRKFEVVDQARLNEAIKQYKLVDSGLSEEADAPKKGKIKSAGFKLYGRVLNMGFQRSTVDGGTFTGQRIVSDVELNIRFMDVETGVAIASKIVKATATKSITAADNTTLETTKVEGSHLNDVEVQVIQNAIELASKKVVNELMELAYPVQIIKVGTAEITINLQKERAKSGQIWKVFNVGEEMVDPSTGESLGSDEELIGEIEITTISPKFSKAKPVGDLAVGKLKEGMIVRPLSEEEAAEKKAAGVQEEKKTFKKRF